LIYYHQNDQQAFNEVIQIGVSTVAGWLDTGDFNGDGKNDILLNGHDAIELFLQSKSGFDDTIRYTIEDAVSKAYRANFGESSSGDFDGVGNLDTGVTTVRYDDDTQTVHILRVQNNQLELVEQFRFRFGNTRHFSGLTIADYEQDGDELLAIQVMALPLKC
jgi:hypothetical protein